MELDGSQHHGSGEYDSERTKWLESRGFKVLRFWNTDVFKDIEAVKAVIVEELRTR